MDDELLTRQEVANEIGVSVASVDRWIKAGKLVAVRLSPQTIRIRRADLDRMILESRTVKGAGNDSSK